MAMLPDDSAEQRPQHPPVELLWDLLERTRGDRGNRVRAVAEVRRGSHECDLLHLLDAVSCTVKRLPGGGAHRNGSERDWLRANATAANVRGERAARARSCSICWIRVHNIPWNHNSARTPA